MSVTPFARTPNRLGDPEDFAADCDSVMGQMAQFVTELNATEQNVNAKEVSANAAATTATTQAGVATDKAAAAAQSAASALQNSTTSATSATALTVGAGAQSFVLDQAGKAFVNSQWVGICDTAAPASRWMLGAITAFNPATGAITVQVAYSNGTGTGSAWAIVAAAPFGSFLPAQAGNAGLGIVTDGNTASWGVSAPDALSILNFIGYFR